MVRQPKTAVFSAEIEVRIYRTPAQSVNLEIDQYGFFEADTNISAIHGLIAHTDNQWRIYLEKRGLSQKGSF